MSPLGQKRPLAKVSCAPKADIQFSAHTQIVRFCSIAKGRRLRQERPRPEAERQPSVGSIPSL
jgi:hypothetical protein